MAREGQGGAGGGGAGQGSPLVATETLSMQVANWSPFTDEHQENNYNTRGGGRGRGLYTDNK